jgi:hypothetical protein
MPDISPLAIAVATVAAFIVSATYYAFTGVQVAAARPGHDAGAANEQPPPWKLAVELLRSLLVTVAVAAAIAEGDIDTVAGVALLTLITWLAFPVTLLTGSVIWENVPVKLAAFHAGDWLVKLIVIAALVGALQ